ncbi:MAG: ABC transporter permease [Gemmatimonadota bacterium]
MDFARELRQTARSLLRDRSFTFLSLLMLATGIAANTTVFSVLDAALLRPLPFDQPSRLVQVWERTPEHQDFSASEPNFLDFRDQARSLELAAYREQQMDLVGNGEPQQLPGAAVSASHFDVLRVIPQIGRNFTAADDTPGAPTKVALLSDGLWRRQFGANRAIVGQTVLLNGAAHVVIGVLPVTATVPAADVFVPLAPNPAGDRGDHWLSMVGRLRAGASIESAQRDLSAIAQRIGTNHPAVRGWDVRVESLHHAIVGEEMRTSVWALMAAVLLFLLLTCANITSLFISRVNARSEELVVRASLGAGRGRLVVHMLFEGLLLGLAGGAAAMVLAAWSIDALQSFAVDRLPALETMQLDIRVAAFTLLCAVLVSMLFSLTPAIRAGRTDTISLLKSGARGGMLRESRRARELLVVVQVGMATVLLLGSGLLINSLWSIQRVHPGFTADHLTAVPLQLTATSYLREEWRQAVFFLQLMGRIEQIPGVTAAAAVTTNPFTPFRFVNDVTPVERAAEIGPSGLLQADWRVVTAGYFRTAQVALLEGRTFDSTDRYGAARVAVVTQSFAQEMWPNQTAVGKRFHWGGVDDDPITVIGVSADLRDVELARAAPPLMFLPVTQMVMPMMTVLVRSQRSIDELRTAIRDAVWSLDRSIPVPEVRQVMDSRARALTRPRMQAALTSSFGLLALIIAALGIYGLVSYQVASRARELGIRCALGAQPRELSVLLLRRITLLVVVGLAAGIAVSLPLASAMRVLLFESASLEPLTILGVSGVLLLAALTAAYVPARRVAKVDPATTLR